MELTQATYTLKEAGEILNLTAQTVRLHIKQGKLNASLIGNKYYISADAIKQYIANREADSAAKLERMRAEYASKETERKQKRHDRYIRTKERQESR